MNLCSLSLLKFKFMKAPLWIKLSLVLPLILLADYILMVILGCATCLFGFGEEYYCNGYCLIGKIILLFSAAFFIYLIYPDIKRLASKNTNPKEY